MKERKRFRQRSKSEPKGQPLPKEIYEKLLDSAVPLIDKVALASRYRQEYNYSVRDMATLLKIDEMLYYRMLRILGSENEMLIDKIRKNECTVNLALKIAREAVQPGDSACDSYFRYKWIQNIDERCENYEIIYESRNNILYRSGDGVFLGVSNGENEKSCQLDDTPRILDVLIECLQNGGFIRWEAGDFVLYAGNDSRHGKLSYFIVSKITGKSLYDVKKARVSYKREPYEGVAAIAANPIGFLLVTITTLTSVISTVKDKIKEARDAAIEAGDAAASLSDEIIDLTGQYIDLCEAVKTDTSAKEDLLKTQENLLEKLGIEKNRVQELVQEYGNLTDAIKAASLEKLTQVERDLRGGLSAKKEALFDAAKANGIAKYSMNHIITSWDKADTDVNRKALHALVDKGMISAGSYGSRGMELWLPTDGAFDPSTVDGIINSYERLGAMMDTVSDAAGSENAVYKALYNAYNKCSDAVT